MAAMTLSATAFFKCNICGETRAVEITDISEVGIAHQYEATFDSPPWWRPYRSSGGDYRHACGNCVTLALQNEELGATAGEVDDA